MQAGFQNRGGIPCEGRPEAGGGNGCQAGDGSFGKRFSVKATLGDQILQLLLTAGFNTCVVDVSPRSSRGRLGKPLRGRAAEVACFAGMMKRLLDMMKNPCEISGHLLLILMMKKINQQEIARKTKTKVISDGRTTAEVGFNAGFASIADLKIKCSISKIMGGNTMSVISKCLK